MKLVLEPVHVDRKLPKESEGHQQHKIMKALFIKKSTVYDTQCFSKLNVIHLEFYFNAGQVVDEDNR